MLSALWLAAWNPKPQVSSRLRYPLGVAVADTDSIVRNAPVPLTKGDTARRYIKLLPGFEAAPQNGQFYVATIDTVDRNIDSDSTSCFVKIKMVTSTGNEVKRIPRVNGILQPVTLSIEDLDSIGFWQNQVNHLWIRPDSSTALTQTLTVNQIGKYEVNLEKNGNVCKSNITISSELCIKIDSTYQCNPNNSLPIIVDDANNYLLSLTEGDTIQAGDFEAIVIDVFGGNSTVGWSGTAKIKVPYLKGTGLLVEFKDAKINSCYQLVNGSKLETVFDQSNSLIYNLDPLSQRFISDIMDFLRVYSGNTNQKDTLGKFIQKLQSINDTSLNKVINGLTQLKNSQDCLGGVGNGRVAQTASNSCAEIINTTTDILKNYLTSIPASTEMEVIAGNLSIGFEAFDESYQRKRLTYFSGKVWTDFSSWDFIKAATAAGVRRQVDAQFSYLPKEKRDVQFTARLGRIFEASILVSLDRLKNFDPFPLNDPTLSPTSVIPDAVIESGLELKEIRGNKTVTVYYWWKKGVFLDAKTTFKPNEQFIKYKGNNPRNEDQIEGFIKVLSEIEQAEYTENKFKAFVGSSDGTKIKNASRYYSAYLHIVTPAGIKLEDEILRKAADKNVVVLHSTTLYNVENPNEIMVDVAKVANARYLRKKPSFVNYYGKPTTLNYSRQ